MISIIGGGPSGCYLAYLLAKSKKEVTIFEEHKEIGKPIQCTGILTRDLLDKINLPKEIILNEITNAEIIGEKEKLNLKISKPNLVIDRSKFDQFLAKKAIDAGANLKLNSKVIGVHRINKEFLIKTEKETIKSDIVIGADGPFSQTSKYLSLFKNKDYLIGLQALVELKNDNSVKFFLRQNGFKWIVPINNKQARVGIAFDRAQKSDLDDFTKELKAKTIEYHAGIIPLFNPVGKRFEKNAYLIGDAAGLVKATTGGGIIQSLISAECCSSSILDNKNYEILWRKKLLSSLTIHKTIFNKLKKMSLPRIDYLLSQLSIQDLETKSRDEIHKWVFKLLLKNPKLLFS
jgi:digeranylgeranylglycerophospholipid reductase